MGRLRRTAAAAAIAATCVAVATPAHADAKKGGQITLHCATIGDVPINTNSGNGTWTPGQAVVGTMVVNPYELHLTFVFTPNDGSGSFSGSQDSVKNAPRNGRLDTCLIDEVFVDVYGTGRFAGSAKISYTKG